MSYEELADDVEFVTAPKATKSNLEIRQNITQVESALTEFEKVSAGLAELAERFPPDLVYDVTTGKGMVEAVAHRAAWREPRLAVERLRKQAKAPVLTLGKDIDARAAWLTEQLLIGERPIDQLIKAEEARKEAIKQAKIDAEIERTMKLQEAVAEINMVAMGAAGKSSVEIAQALADLTAAVPTEEVFQDMLPQALAARTATLAKLDMAHKAALHTEAEAAKLAAERAELAALRAAAAKLAAEAAEQKAKADAAERVERQRIANEQAERQRVMDEQAAALAAQQAEAARVLAEQQMEIDRQRAELEALRTPPPAGEPPAPVPPAPASLVTQNNAARMAIAESAAVDAPLPPDAELIEGVACLKLGAICARFGGLGLTVNFITDTLGLPYRSKVKASTYWPLIDLPMIRDALKAHADKCVP